MRQGKFFELDLAGDVLEPSVGDALALAGRAQVPFPASLNRSAADAAGLQVSAKLSKSAIPVGPKQ